jgi:hypothetical protein
MSRDMSKDRSQIWLRISGEKYVPIILIWSILDSGFRVWWTIYRKCRRTGRSALSQDIFIREVKCIFWIKASTSPLWHSQLCPVWNALFEYNILRLVNFPSLSVQQFICTTPKISDELSFK